jgi:phage baseplate assembly protein W
VFENITEIQKARLSQAIRNLIARYEPRMEVQAVTVSAEGTAQAGYAYVVNVVYTIADVEGDFNIPLGF